MTTTKKGKGRLYVVSKHLQTKKLDQNQSNKMSDSDDDLPIAEFVKKRNGQILTEDKPLNKIVKLREFPSTKASVFEDGTTFIPLHCFDGSEDTSPLEQQNFITLKKNVPGEDKPLVVIVAKNSEDQIGKKT